MRTTLSSQGVNTTTWAENNVTGYFMGLALGNNTWNNVDYVTCEYTRTNNSVNITESDAIICTDRHSMSNDSRTNIDDIQDYVTLSSSVIIDTAGVASFEVTFERLFVTNDTNAGEDY